MHMTDALISPAVGGAMWAAAAGVAAFSVKKTDAGSDTRKLPEMAVMGAFVFAAQMINFAIPGTGSSGHLAGGLLLAAMLGPAAGFLALAAVLLIQALLFADGGLLAFGCNLINLGFFSCFVAYPLIYKNIVRTGSTRARIMTASVIAGVAALQLGAFGVVIETVISGSTALSVAQFAAWMQPIHLVIGLIEGLVTGAIIIFISENRPEMLHGAAPAGSRSNPRMSYPKIISIFLLAAMILAFGISLLASADPDGLEWSLSKVTGQLPGEAGSAVHAFLAYVQRMTAFFPDYRPKARASGAAFSGSDYPELLGGIAIVAIAAVSAVMIKIVRKGRAKNGKS